MGPLHPGELAQVVPGRMLNPPRRRSRAAALAVSAAVGEADADPVESLRKVIGQTIQERAEEESAAAPEPDAPAARAVAPRTSPWNPAFAQTSEHDGGTILHLDLGFAIKLLVENEDGKAVVLGKFEVDSGIHVGVLTDSGDVRPLAHGVCNSRVNR